MSQQRPPQSQPVGQRQRSQQPQRQAQFQAPQQVQTKPHQPTQQAGLDTADVLNEVSRDLSKALWFVEAHLQGQGIGDARRPQSVQ